MTCGPSTAAACDGDSPLSIYDGVLVDLCSSTTSFPSHIPHQDTAPAASFFVLRWITFAQSDVKSFVWHFHKGHIFTHPGLHLRLSSSTGEGTVQYLSDTHRNKS